MRGGPYPQIDKPIVLSEYSPRNTSVSNQNSVEGNFSNQASYINQASYLGWAGAMAWDYDPTGQNSQHLIDEAGSKHSDTETLQWYSINKFGL